MPDHVSRLSAALADRYRIEREVGAGGMATVYLATDLKHRRSVALKVLRPELAQVLGSERFLREIEIAAQIEHPHVLTLIDSGEAAGLLYYVMPFVKGESLRARVAREGRLPISDTVRVLRDVADGLAEAHRQGLVHRDVKPDNVMLSGRHAVVTDFGVAKAVTTATSAQHLTTAGVALGTPAYMAPEQITADPGIDHRTDVYAFGVMAYELLTGSTPFVGATQQEILAAHLTEDPEPVTGARPDTPPELAELVMRCLAKPSDERWHSMDDVLQRLEVMATPSGGVPSMRVAAPATGTKSPRRFFVRRALVIAPLIVVGVAFLALTLRRSAAVADLRERLAPAADSGRLDAVYAMLSEAGVSLGARGLGDVARAVGGRVTIETTPAGAAVTVLRVRSERNGFPPTPIGSSPVRGHLLVAGSYVVSVARPGYEPLAFTVPVGAGDTLSLGRTLVSDAWSAAGMVYVDEGAVVGPLADRFAGRTIPAFLIDRHEVSNEQFMTFVADGGYRNAAFWPESLQAGDRALPWAVAIGRFVDRTGLPGPRNWSGGTFPDGRGTHPVTGVSWYEARAYARWAEKELPTLAQWWRAALGDTDQPYPWGGDHATIDTRSNFSMTATTPVAAHPAGASAYGAFDMAGNVREWLAESPEAGRYPAIGGSWQDPTYMFYTPNIDRFAPGYANEAIGFRLVKAVPAPVREEN